MRVYLSGPMSGLPDNNFPAFDAAAERLRTIGYSVVNPAELSRGMDHVILIHGREPACWHNYMAQAIVAMQTVDAIHYLPGWQNSYGARIEAIVAEKMQLKEIL